MKIINIIGIPIGIVHLILMAILLWVVIMIAQETRFEPFKPDVSDINDPAWRDYEIAILNYDISVKNQEGYTLTAAVITIFLSIYFLVINPINLIKIKTVTSKVFSFFSICLSVGFIFWSILMMQKPGHISFDEVGIAFVGFSFWMVTSSIIQIYQIRSSLAKPPLRYGNEQVLDDI